MCVLHLPSACFPVCVMLHKTSWAMQVQNVSSSTWFLGVMMQLYRLMIDFSSSQTAPLQDAVSPGWWTRLAALSMSTHVAELCLCSLPIQSPIWKHWCEGEIGVGVWAEYHFLSFFSISHVPPSPLLPDVIWSAWMIIDLDITKFEKTRLGALRQKTRIYFHYTQGLWILSWV